MTRNIVPLNLLKFYLDDTITPTSAKIEPNHNNKIRASYWSHMIDVLFVSQQHLHRTALYHDRVYTWTFNRYDP